MNIFIIFKICWSDASVGLKQKIAEKDSCYLLAKSFYRKARVNIKENRIHYLILEPGLSLGLQSRLSPSSGAMRTFRFIVTYIADDYALGKFDVTSLQ